MVHREKIKEIEPIDKCTDLDKQLNFKEIRGAYDKFPDFFV